MPRPPPVYHRDYQRLLDLLASHGFATAAQYMLPRDVLDWHATEATWRDYPASMAQYPSRVRPRAKPYERT